MPRQDLSERLERLRASKEAIDRLTKTTVPRPRALSLWSEEAGTSNISDYTSWQSLTDRSFFGRHLPPAAPEDISALPVDRPYVSRTEYGDVTALFKRTQFLEAPRTSLLFSIFAQWFTDSFLRTHPTDRRRNSSNHQIDMCQIYGLRETTTDILRSSRGGRLKSQMWPENEKEENQEEYPPFLFDASGSVKTEFRALPYIADGTFDRILERSKKMLKKERENIEDRKPYYFATGLERGNSSVGYTAMSTLFLREHNRLCRELEKRHPTWNDERLFQTARMIVTIMEIKIVVEEYIDHISHLPKGTFLLDYTFAEDREWYRTNWIAVEFDLLYRWHSLIPDNVKIAEETYQPHEFLVNNKLLLSFGLDRILVEASNQPAGRIGLWNTPDFLLEAEYFAIKMGRDSRLKSFNEYRKHFELSAYSSIEELITKDPKRPTPEEHRLIDELNRLYGKDVNKVEFLVGLYAEPPSLDRLPKVPGAKEPLLGQLMTAMIAYDAFTQALTNPLLSRNIFNSRTLSKYGMEQILETTSLDDLVARNTKNHVTGSVTMDFPASGAGQTGDGASGGATPETRAAVKKAKKKSARSGSEGKTSGGKKKAKSKKTPAKKPKTSRRATKKPTKKVKKKPATRKKKSSPAKKRAATRA